MFLHHGRIFILAIVLLCSEVTLGQTVWYPANCSDLLKSAAADLTINLSKAIPGSQFNLQQYSGAIPATGVILVYDSSIIGNSACRIESNGSSYIKFTARQDNGLCFGLYRYLADVGFRFYLPGSLWEKIPSLTSPYKQLNKTVQSAFKYNSWFISGGYSKWGMDNDDSYYWDTYTGKNGHEWAQYQRRNNMTGDYRFSGHRGDLYTPEFIQKFAADPCLVASSNGERNANVQSAPDINNPAAKDLWAREIEEKYRSYKNTITGNTLIYTNLYHNFDFGNEILGVEVADGARWGNSVSAQNCITGNWNGQPYPSESDQQFLLSNYSAQKISTTLPGKRFQSYAYDGHSNVPSASIIINPLIDVQVVSTAFQLESSSKGLLSRWYSRHPAISEYHYLNIPQWGGETPVTSATELKQTIQRIKQKNGQGIVVETSPAKFSSLPMLYAANRYIQENKNFDSSINEFVTTMFSHNSSVFISQLLSLWGNEQVFTVNDFIKDNRYKLPLYLQLVKKAEDAAITENATARQMQRLRELKAYLHYMILYFDVFSDNRDYPEKAVNVEKLCLYLASISDLQIVNSLFLIQDLLNKFPAGHALWQKFDALTGSAYQGGTLAQITTAEIDQDFNSDLAHYGQTVTGYNIENLRQVMDHFETSKLLPLEKIDVKIVYTNGKDYPNRSEFYVYAPAAGSFNVSCAPQFNMPGKGFINVTAESADDPSLVLKDVTITRDFQPGVMTINLPAKGFYKLSVLSKYQTNNQLSIETKGNVFFRNGPFYGNMVENYRLDNTKMPRFVYVPAAVSKLYFSSNNICPADGPCFTASDMQSAFSFRDQWGKIPLVKATADPSLFYMDVPQGGGFWQVNTMREYNLCFANIANVEIYAEEKKCATADFSIKLIKKGDECFTRMEALNNSAGPQWEIYDGGRWTFFSNTNRIDLPLLSPYAIITFKNGDGCQVTKRTGSTASYASNLQNCASTADKPSTGINVFPLPSAGKFNFQLMGVPADFDEITIFDAHGSKVMSASHTSFIDLQYKPAGIYIFRAKKGMALFNGKLVKL